VSKTIIILGKRGENKLRGEKKGKERKSRKRQRHFFKKKEIVRRGKEVRTEKKSSFSKFELLWGPTIEGKGQRKSIGEPD